MLHSNPWKEGKSETHTFTSCGSTLTVPY